MTSPAASRRSLQAGEHTLRLGDRPWLMGIVNATPDSFSDAGMHPTLASRFVHASSLLEAGADVIDIGGESGVTNRPPVTPEEEAERVLELVERVSGELGALVSVETYKPAVAEAAIAAGARIVNDVSGLRDPAIADVCARTGAALVVMHTRAEPKHKLEDPRYEDPAADVEEFLRGRMELAVARGMSIEQLILDPGPDFSKTPAQTVAVLRALPALHALERPLLLAVSRKDFIGAITGRPPRERLAGTLAALAYGVDAGAHIVRVHDVREASDFLAVRAILSGTEALAADASLDDELRWETPADPSGAHARLPPEDT